MDLLAPTSRPTVGFNGIVSCMASVERYCVRKNTASLKGRRTAKPASSAADRANAFRYSINNMGAMLSQELSSADWEYAHPRIKWMPFAWLDEIVGATSSSFSYKKTAAFVDTQLQAMREWGMGEMFPIFDHSGFNTASYVDHNGVLVQLGDGGRCGCGSRRFDPPDVAGPDPRWLDDHRNRDRQLCDVGGQVGGQRWRLGNG